jgi:hypothetical protein
MKGIAKEMAEDSQITPTDETKKIAGYNCRKYIVTTGNRWDSSICDAVIGNSWIRSRVLSG